MIPYLQSTFDLVRNVLSPSTPNEGGYSFDYLPCEIIIEILPYMPDLITLYNLLHASPIAYRIFNQYNAAQTVESVLSSGHTCSQIQFLFRFCAKLQFGHLHEWDIEILAKRAFVDPLDASFRDDYSPEPLALNTPLRDIHRLLRMARDIHTVALDCVDDCLRAFYSLESQQQQQKQQQQQVVEQQVSERYATDMLLDDAAALATVVTAALDDIDEEMSLLSRDGLTVLPKTAKLPQRNGIRPQPPPPPPPTAATWAEEQRVARALWRMQLAYDADLALIVRSRLYCGGPLTLWCLTYRTAVVRQRYAWHVARGGGSYASNSKVVLYPVELHDRRIMNPEYRELLSVVDYIGRRFGEEKGDEFAEKSVEIDQLLREEWEAARAETAAGQGDPSDSDVDDVDDVDDVESCGGGGDDDDVSSRKWWMTLTPTAYDDEGIILTTYPESHAEEEAARIALHPAPTHAEKEALLKPSPAVSRYLRSRDDKRPPPKLDLFQFSAFYRCGFAFWSEERLRDHGFLSATINEKGDAASSSSSSSSSSQQPQQQQKEEENARVDAAWLSILTPEDIAWEMNKREKERLEEERVAEIRRALFRRWAMEHF